MHEWHEGRPPTTDVSAWVGTTLAALHTLPCSGTPGWEPHPVEEWREWLDEAPNDFTHAVRVLPAGDLRGQGDGGRHG
ncbi:MAG: hypothetical protein ABIQ18_10090 [Umezawaea sp.]